MGPPGQVHARILQAKLRRLRTVVDIRDPRGRLLRDEKGEPQVEPEDSTRIEAPPGEELGATDHPREEVAVAVPTPSTEEHAVVPARAVPEGARHNGPGPDDEFLVALA